jgi:hypothetical protein
MVVLAADSHEILAQLMRASASLISNQGLNGIQLPLSSENSSQGNISPSALQPVPPHYFLNPSPCKRLTPFRERMCQQQQSSEKISKNSSPQILKLYSI